MSSNDLTELKQKRLKWVEANRENGFDEGINRLLTELYPDNAHFIYELLQNAEDPQATEVTFKLTESAVEFSHNGIRLFEFKDVESITSIGNSTKRDDATSIGKFGVGFKAVFAYTNTPEIHSGDFHFQIHDLVVPETKSVEQSIENQTRFVFPFDNPKKLSVLAASEVEKGLCALGNNTLLFLSHIRKINYSLPDGSEGSLERIDHENGRIEIRAKHPHSEETISHWLHFHKDVEVTDTDGNIKNCRVAMAYQLEKVADKNKDSETWKIIPVRGGGQVSIYFPAEKETSKLRFHIHAPFASTVARDSVRDCDDNQQLRDYLAELIVESFSAIRDQEMLVMSFLAVLPTPKDYLAEFYELIREKIVDAFKTQLLTPTKSGSHAASGALYRGAAKISDVIEDEDLSVLTGYGIPLWASNAPQRNSREDNFLESLSVDKWDLEQVSEIFSPANKEKTVSWLETKDDNWLRRFYVLLKDAKQYHKENYSHVLACFYQPWAGKNFPLVRVNSEDGVKHVVGNQAYFESSHGHISTNDIHIVKREVYTKDNAKREIDENAEKFLESIGVRQFNEKAVIELRLQFYQSTPPTQITDEYYNDIRRFVSYWKENATEGSYYKRQAEELFKAVRFLLGVSDEKLHWKNATEICLDNPFIETGLSGFPEIHGKNPIYNQYSEKLKKDELIDFISFLKVMGAMYKFEVIKLDKHTARQNPQNPYHPSKNNCKWSEHSIDDDYSIPDLYRYLKAKNFFASRIIWDIVINANKRFGKALFKPSKSNAYPLREVESLFIFTLKKQAWIPNKSGVFCTPQAITRETLHHDFRFDDSNGFLTAIEFGKDTEDLTVEIEKLKEKETASFKEKEKIAKELGADSVDEVKEAVKLFREMKAHGKSADDVRASWEQKTIPNFEDDYSSNPDRRAEKVQETAADAPEKRSTLKLRSVAEDNTETKKAAKSYLKDKYTDDDKILYCQICNKEMPFKVSDGSYYFEVVQLIGDTQKRYKENYIALCPTDAAKFQYANPSKDKISDLVNTLIDDRSPDDINDSGDDENSFEIVLAANTETVQFRRVHLIDLKAVLL